MLSDRFGAFEAIANSSIELARVAPEEEMAMEPPVAEAVVEFADDLRVAAPATTQRRGRDPDDSGDRRGLPHV